MNNNTISVCEEMLKERGYTIQKIEETNDIVKIFFLNELGEKSILSINYSKLDVNSLKNEMVYVSRNNIKHCIFVYSNVTSYSYNIKNFYKNIKIEIFKIHELNFNITKHFLVPKHEKLNNTEKMEFIHKWGEKIPQMLVDDPISKFYYYKKNDIIKITRKTGYVTYRIVI
jgi:DNA-directed RNA polymerase I, II, and III subunit RPABC1